MPAGKVPRGEVVPDRAFLSISPLAERLSPSMFLGKERPGPGSLGGPVAPEARARDRRGPPAGPRWCDSGYGFGRICGDGKLGR